MDWPAESWGHMVRKALTSYWEAMTNLYDARLYHESRAKAPFSDDVSSKPFPAIEIPLFWGTF